MISEKNKRLVNNSIIFTLGNLGSKLITFVMLPFYTARLSQSGYGIADLITTTVSLLTPIISLSIFEAVLRFNMENKYNSKKVISNALWVTLLGGMLLLLCLPLVYVFHINYGSYILLILFGQAVQSLLSQYAKSINRTAIYAKNGILLSFLTAGLNILFMYFFSLGIEGYLLSIVISLAIANYWMFMTLNISANFSFSLIDTTLIKEMFSYSIPLIPNSIAFWINNVANRYFILYFLGQKANGIFAISNKIPTLIGVVNTIFFQAWQISVIKEFEDEDRIENKNAFYSKTFSLYAQLLFIGVSGILLCLKPLMDLLVSSNFSSSWRYVPFLLLSTIYSSFSGFFGQYYIAAKQTKGVFNTTIVGAILNLFLNLILIPMFSLTGASISSAISFFVIWIIRVKDTNRFVKTHIELKKMFINHFLLFLQIACLFLFTNSLKSMFFIQLPLFAVLLGYNCMINKSIFKKLRK
ncbi:MAG: polysaccharide biosynthesis C-terminal domain-containing protein [Lactobacillus sp.]|nr:polysaccharide biosynthesis C-terminal domain-containing protein [Lactobacillus sp.]